MHKSSLVRYSVLSVVVLAVSLFWILVGPIPLTPAQEVTPPAQPLMARVTAEYEPVRQAPCAVTGTIAQLYRGQSVELTGYRSADGRWLQVTLLGIDAGWVAAEAVESPLPVAELRLFVGH